MRTQLEFKSNIFPSYDNESEGVNWNVGIFGKRLATFLAEKLANKGYKVYEPGDEDWGWYIDIEHNGNFRLFVGCGSHDENGFHCFVDPDKPQIRKWFKRIDVREQVEKLAETLHQILSEEPSVKELEWVENRS